MADDVDSAAGELTHPADHATDSDTDGFDADGVEPSKSPIIGSRPGIRMALTMALVFALAMSGLVGWLGYLSVESRRAQHEHNEFLQMGRQGALNLTTINYTEIDADVQRIMDSSTGAFYDDFQKRAPAFIDVVKQAQSKSEGAVTEAGVESDQGGHAQVLVAVTVKTSTAGAAEPHPRLWRMRIGVQTTNQGAKVSSVEFVP